MVSTQRTTRLVLALIGLAAALLLPGRIGQVHADGDYIDIGGKLLHVNLRLTDADTGIVGEQPVPPNQFPAGAKDLLTTPLSTTFDRFWSGTKDGNGQTLRDRSCDAAKSKTADAIHSKTGQTAHDISCNLSETGSLRAAIFRGPYFVRDADNPEGDFIDATRLILSYYLSGNSVSFSVTTPDAFGIGLPSGADPRFSVTFDSEILVGITLPNDNLAIPGSCTFTAEGPASVQTHNAYLDSANLTGDLVKDVNAILRGVGFGGIFPAAEEALNSATSSVPTPISSQLGSLSSGCSTLFGLGFHRFEASVDPDQGVVWRFIHPRDDAPAVTAAGRVADSTQPSFIRPLVHPTQPTVAAGNTLTLEGQYFPINLSTALHISIGVTGYCKGGATQLEWGPAGGAIQRQTLAEDGQGNCPSSYDATGLSPSTSYQFRARTCDALTCSAWSPFLKAATGPAGDDTVTLTIDGVAIPPAAAPCVSSRTIICADSGPRVLVGVPTAVPCVSTRTIICADSAPRAVVMDTTLGTAMVTSQGTFSTTVTIPAGTTAGTHTISATLGDKGAATTVQVQGAGTVVAASIAIVSSIGTPLTSTQTDANFTLFGTGFAPGTVTVYLDSASGFYLGTATAGADGTFRAQLLVPFSQAGPHTLVAVQTTDAGTTSVTAAVTFVTPSVIR